MLETLSISVQSFFNRMVILLEDNYYENFHHKSLGTFVRERTRGITEVTDLLTSSLGTNFSRKKKRKKSVYL